MGLGIIGLAFLIVVVIILKNIISFGLKVVFFVILAAVLGITVWICSVSPDMHKPFSMETIEYLLKFNKDGSMTTTKQVTRTVLKDKGE